MAGVDLVAAQAADDQQARAWLEAHQEGEPLQRFVGDPLQVVQRQHEGPVAVDKDARQRLEEPLALPALGQRLRLRQGGILGVQLRQQPRQFRAPDRVQPPDQRHHRLAAQAFDQCRVGQVAAGRVGPRQRRGDALLAGPVRHLFGQTGLADAGLAAEHDTLHCAARGCAPGSLQRLPLVLPAYQTDAAVACPAGRYPIARDVDQTFVEFTRRGAGSNAQLLFQRRSAGVIDAHGCHAVVVERVQPHQAAIGCLVQWIGGQQAARPVDGLPVAAPFFVQQHALFQRGQVLLSQPLAFALDPVVVAVGRQRALVDSSRGL